MAYADNGDLLVADVGAARIRRLRASDGTVSTIAGSGVPGFSDGPALSSRMNYPSGLATWGGAVLFADAGNHRIRLLGADGAVSTLAGNGTGGFCGDGQPATSACLFEPWGVAVDASAGGGVVYVADTLNSRVRAVSAGVISTFAVVAGCRPQALAVYAPRVGRRQLLAASTACHVIHTIDVATGAVSVLAGDGWRDAASGAGRYAGDGGPATLASLRSPQGVSVDAWDRVYVADAGSSIIRVVTPWHSSRLGVDTIDLLAGVAGNASFSGDGCAGTAATLNGPSGVAVSPTSLDVAVADRYNFRVRLVGLAAAASLTPTGTVTPTQSQTPSFSGTRSVSTTATGTMTSTL